MAVISKIFCMRRGLASSMRSSKANTVLASGENFLEIQGSTVGKSKVKMKMGDGSTAYKDLPYVLGDTSTDPISFQENAATDATTALGSVTTGQSLDNIVAGLKKAVSLNTQSLTELNDDLDKKFSNYYTSEEVDKKLQESMSNIDLSSYYNKTDIDNKLKLYLDSTTAVNTYLTKTEAANTYMSKSNGLNNSLSFYNYMWEFDKGSANRFLIFNKIVPCVVFSSYGIIYFGAKDKNDIYIGSGYRKCIVLSQGFHNDPTFISGDLYAPQVQLMFIDDRSNNNHFNVQIGILYPSSYGSISLRQASTF